MIHSMTGFGRAENTLSGGGFSVEIRSLNHRFFEFSLKASPLLYSLEDRIRELCQRVLKRGKVSVGINEKKPSTGEAVTLDEDILKFYLSSARKLQKTFHLKDSLSVGELFTLPRLFTVEKKAEAPEKIWKVLKPVLEKAIHQMAASRAKEGKTLYKDLSGRIRRIETTLGTVEKHAANLPREHYEKLRERIRKLFEVKVEKEERLWQEAMLWAERSDVTEEIVRFKSHLGLFQEKMEKGREVGKELDFILQEMNRETNTLGSKVQDSGIAKEVVFIKAEIEKIREQIQNIE